MLMGISVFRFIGEASRVSPGNAGSVSVSRGFITAESIEPTKGWHATCYDSGFC